MLRVGDGSGAASYDDALAGCPLNTRIGAAQVNVQNAYREHHSLNACDLALGGCVSPAVLDRELGVGTFYDGLLTVEVPSGFSVKTFKDPQCRRQSSVTECDPALGCTSAEKRSFPASRAADHVYLAVEPIGPMARLSCEVRCRRRFSEMMKRPR